ncbi:hypothetical protein V6Z11_1Z137200 [Gossypium hirsutum]
MASFARLSAPLYNRACKRTHQKDSITEFIADDNRKIGFFLYIFIYLVNLAIKAIDVPANKKITHTEYTLRIQYLYTRTEKREKRFKINRGDFIFFSSDFFRFFFSLYFLICLLIFYAT